MSFEPILIVLFCTIIQNIFGVGILVFGTPILLSLDYGILDILGILLPPSLFVSLLQVMTVKSVVFPKPKILIQSMIGVISGVTFLIFFSVPVSIYFVTAIAMLLSGVLRFNFELRRVLGQFLAQPKLRFFFLNGFFHGFSNLGGILLVLKNTLMSTDKNQALINTASIYIIYVSSQIFVLCGSGNYALFFEGIKISPIVVLFSYVMGARPLALFSAKQMDYALGIFFVSVSVVLFYKMVQLI